MIDKIDAMMEDDGDRKGQMNLNDLEKITRGLNTATLCDKDELKWPVRFLKFNFTKMSFRLLAVKKRRSQNHIKTHTF